MTRNNNSNRKTSPSHSIVTNRSSNGDHLVQLPDLSGLKDDEKQHILNVLLRDENLRNKHLARFLQLRKEVADLEEGPQSASTSACARCQTPFGFIFNTGDTCPKCSAKVCKQCRLMYNVHDNGWLCKLCCKQMQLMSYSGEWIYSQRSNLRKTSVTASEVIRNSLSPRISTRNSNGVSSSDTETEDRPDSPYRTRSSAKKNRSNPQGSSEKINRMLIPCSADEQKLNSIQENVQKRPSYTLSSERTREQAFSSRIPTAASSDDVDSLYDQSTIYTDRTSTSSIHMNMNEKSPERNSAIQKSVDSPSVPPNQSDRPQKSKQDIDCASVTSSEWGADSERGEPAKLQRHNAPIKHNSKSNLSSNSSLTGSIKSLRNVAHRISKPHLTTSRESLDSRQKPKDKSSETTSTKIGENQTKSGMYPTWSSG